MNEESVNPIVVVFRHNNGEEIVGILLSADDDVVKIESPHRVHVNFQTGTLGITPYCILTEERYYTFRKTDLIFLAVANERVTTGYLATLHLTNFDELSKILNPQEEEEFDPIDKPIIPGNGTIH